MFNISENFKGTYGTLYYVSDMNKSVQYYKTMFNLNPEVESPGWSTFSIKGHRICLHATKDDIKTKFTGSLIINVSNIEAIVAELKSCGVEFMGDIHEVEKNGFAVDLKDPNGNVIGIYEYKG